MAMHASIDNYDASQYHLLTWSALKHFSHKTINDFSVVVISYHQYLIKKIITLKTRTAANIKIPGYPKYTIIFKYYF